MMNYDMIDSFVEGTLDVLFLRKEDSIMIIRPNKIQHLNDSAFEILYALYNDRKKSAEIVEELSVRYTKDKNELQKDVVALIKSIEAIMKEDYSNAPMIETIPFDPGSIKYPALSEIALTYHCQNRCDFCYASSPYRGDELTEMTTEEVKIVIDKIRNDAHIPTISFTGGEPTLRKDLPELVEYASKIGMRVNLITNGIRCADKSFVKSLADAGLNSAQVSLESHDSLIHDDIVGKKGAWEKCIQGIENLKESEIYTHTNTTICQKNKEHLFPLVDFIHEKFNFPYLSMNMIITTGIATDNDNIEIGYSTIGDIIEPVIDHCEILGIKFVWYSPTPYCIFNPVDHNLGSKSCACVSGLLSVNPAGEVLPCSSFDVGIGNLVKKSFHQIWTSDAALYWRERRYMPPVCKKCTYEELCGGACPLYWENCGSFKEIEDAMNKKPYIRNVLWNIEKNLRVKSKGVKGLTSGR